MQDQEISDGLLATVVINNQHYRGGLDAVRCRCAPSVPLPVAHCVDVTCMCPNPKCAVATGARDEGSMQRTDTCGAERECQGGLREVHQRLLCAIL